jgi:hypothetical protein
MNTNRFFVKLLMGALVLALLLSACAKENAIQTPEGQALVEQGNAYMTCFQQGDFKCAYGLLSPEDQEQIDEAVHLAGGTVNLASLFKNFLPKVSGWSFDRVQISTRNGETTGSLRGKVYTETNLAAGGVDLNPNHTVKLEFVKDGDTWTVTSSSIE